MNSQKIRLLFVFFLAVISNVSIAQVYSWKQKADYGGGEVFNPIWMVINDKGYVGTGRSLPAVNRKDFWQYDPATDIWTQMMDVPGAGRYGAVGFAIGNYGYAGTGWTPTPVNDFYRYDPSTNNWTSIANFPAAARYTSTSFSVGGYGFVGLGYSPCRSDFWRYNPTTNSWSQSSSFPGGSRQSVVSFVIDTTAYVGTGLCSGTVYNDFYKYNYSSNIWTQIADLPDSGRTAGFSFALNGKGYYLMGCDYNNGSQNFNIYRTMWEYEPSTDQWTQLPDFPGKGLFHGVSFAIDSIGYIGLGTDTIAFSTHYVSDFWEFSPDSVSGFSELNSDVSFMNIYPNPVTTHCSILHKDLRIGDEIRFYDLQGKIVTNLIIDELEIASNVDVSSFSPGIYICSLSRKDRIYSSSRLLKVR